MVPSLKWCSFSHNVIFKSVIAFIIWHLITHQITHKVPLRDKKYTINIHESIEIAILQRYPKKDRGKSKQKFLHVL